jgi:hypothetical protein
LRKAAERTIPCLRRRIGSFACTITAREARNYHRAASVKNVTKWVCAVTRSSLRRLG